MTNDSEVIAGSQSVNSATASVTENHRKPRSASGVAGEVIDKLRERERSRNETADSSREKHTSSGPTRAA